MPTLLTYLLLTLTLTSLAHKASDWHSRSIYQLLTDRFSKTTGDKSPCTNISNYCGGTFRGIINNLDYISGMGFDAIWISPIVANTPGGYHGYWAQNIFEINPEFGTADEFKQLINACHARDMWVMVDVVGNHMGNMLTDGDFTDKIPFNDSSYYHSNTDCSAIDQNDDDLLQTCWLAQLPDLNQNHDFVRETLLKWITDLVTTYNIDGLRIDTVPYVAKHFWKSFTDAAGVYTLGEVFNANIPYDAGYEGPVDGVLNYPLFFALRNVFQANNSMNYLQDYYRDAANAWPDTELLGNFVDNHDNARFLSNGSNKAAFKSALAFCLTAVGIPITYYGSEQEFNGGNDPDNREALWGNMDGNSEIYRFLKTINAFRKENEIYKYPQIERLVDDNFYAFSRGKSFFAFTNSPNVTRKTITDHPYEDSTILCNVLRYGDCVAVKNGQFDIELVNGEVKMYAPKYEKKQEKTENAFEENRLSEKIGSSQAKIESKIEDKIHALYSNLQSGKNRRFRTVRPI